eukprot:8661982-Pyramimonas_sp.AAC.1
MQRCREGLGEQVCAIVFRRDAEKFHCALGHPVSNEVVTNVDVFRPCVVDVILRDESCTDVVDIGLDGQVDSGQLVDEIDK